MPENHKKSEVISDRPTDRQTDRQSELKSRAHATKKVDIQCRCQENNDYIVDIGLFRVYTHQLVTHIIFIIPLVTTVMSCVMKRT